MFDNQIYARNFDSITINENYNDFLVINSDRFKQYLEKQNFICFTKSYADILKDWDKSYRNQTLFINDENDIRLEHFFYSYRRISALCTYIVKTIKNYYKWDQQNSKTLYCPLKAERYALDYFDKMNTEFKEMCITFYHGGARWGQFCTKNIV